MTHTVIIRGDTQRALARRLIDQAPLGYVVTVKEPRRTGEQNDKMWSMLTDIARAKPDGRIAVPNIWKALFMQAINHEVQFEMGLDGRPFPIGHQSSRLSKAQMADLITFIDEYGARHGVRWSNEQEQAA